MLTLLAIKNFFKKYWGFLVGGLALFTYFAWGKRSKVDNLASHVRQVGNDLSNAVDSARDKEKTAAAEENKQHEKNAEEIKNKYEQKKDQLDEETRVEAERLFEEHKDDPEKLAEELSRVTGFRIILPKD